VRRAYARRDSTNFGRPQGQVKLSGMREPARTALQARNPRGAEMATKTAAKKKSRRTVLYSSGGKKLYAVRDASGKFKDIQQYARAHAMDIKRGSSAEAATAVKKAKKAATKAVKAVAKRPLSAKKAAPAKKAAKAKSPRKSAVK
jgi:hypothetical protein